VWGIPGVVEERPGTGRGGVALLGARLAGFLNSGRFSGPLEITFRDSETQVVSMVVGKETLV
jgi:hypothetical protein